MKIQYASDLHLEFLTNSAFMKNYPLEVVGDILLLCGDINYLREDGNYEHPFWDWASANYKQVIVVIGNHELYNSFDISHLKEGTKIPIRENVAYYYNTVISIEDIDIIASTLWSEISPREAQIIQKRVSDFRRILDIKIPLCVERFNSEHHKCIAFIKKAVSESKAKKIIVATHHLPTTAVAAPEFQSSSMNSAFVSEQREFIESSKIDYWIYGHSHRNIEAKLGHTTLLTNQLGYVAHEDYSSFKRNKHIEIYTK